MRCEKVPAPAVPSEPPPLRLPRAVAPWPQDRVHAEVGALSLPPFDEFEGLAEGLTEGLAKGLAKGLTEGLAEGAILPLAGAAKPQLLPCPYGRGK